MIELWRRAGEFGDQTAVIDATGSYTYSDLVAAAGSVAAGLLDGVDSLNGARVAMMIPPSFDFVAVQWGIWLAGGIAVPLALSHPDPELAYVIEDSGASIVVASDAYEERLQLAVSGKSCRLVTPIALTASQRPPSHAPLDQQVAMLLYTSGTTGRAKGVVWRHGAIQTQAEVMSAAWGWRPDDRALLVLPLHHVHGLLNVVTTALWNGATVEMHRGFEPGATWDRLVSGQLTVFMAVPTIYRRLLTSWERFPADRHTTIFEALSQMRLMVSGSAALPVATLEAWKEASGHVLLERYGMTEVGMALSNPYAAERIPGAVGAPLPTVEARVVDESDAVVADGEAGRLQIRGPSVFREYWGRPDATADSFVDGWFRTGDVVVVADGVYRILGRESIDIIKTGGEKVSALEIEDVLRRHPLIDDCAVVGIADSEWGERVVVAATSSAADPSLEELRQFCSALLAPAKIPRSLLVVDDLPRNALGKVLKVEVRRLFE